MTSSIKALGKTLGFTIAVIFKLLMCVASAAFLMRYIEGQGSLFDLSAGMAGVITLGVYGVKCVDSAILNGKQSLGISSKLGAFISAIPLTFTMGVVWDNWDLMQVNGVSERTFMIGLFLGVAIVKGAGLITIMETMISSGSSLEMSRKYLISISFMFASLLILASTSSSNSIAIIIAFGTVFTLFLFVISVIRASMKADSIALGTP